MKTDYCWVSLPHIQCVTTFYYLSPKSSTPSITICIYGQEFFKIKVAFIYYPITWGPLVVKKTLVSNPHLKSWTGRQWWKHESELKTVIAAV